jgi:hypothetical protein
VTCFGAYVGSWSEFVSICTISTKLRDARNLPFKKRFDLSIFDTSECAALAAWLKANTYEPSRLCMAAKNWATANAQDKAARQSSGLYDAELDVDRASNAERDALMAVCSYRCTTLKETRLKAECLSGDHRLGELLDERHVEALLQSFCKGGA